MAASPPWKVYSAAGEYLASTHHAEHACVLVAHLGTGATVRLGHGTRDVVWTEPNTIADLNLSTRIVAIQDCVEARRAKTREKREAVARHNAGYPLTAKTEKEILELPFFCEKCGAPSAHQTDEHTVGIELAVKL